MRTSPRRKHPLRIRIIGTEFSCVCDIILASLLSKSLSNSNEMRPLFASFVLALLQTSVALHRPNALLLSGSFKGFWIMNQGSQEAAKTK